jgi:hypoxanthine phosphoribosyltransferase
MNKEFLPYDTVRNNALKMAHHIHSDGFVPDVIYALLRGGAYVANVASEYFKIARPNGSPVLYAAVVARSYSGVNEQKERITIDGWTYSPENLKRGDKILLMDDVFDSGRTINYLAAIILQKGVMRHDLKIAVHDYKVFTYQKEQLPIQPDYWCRKFVIEKPGGNHWIHYLSHELMGLSPRELEEHYYSRDPGLRAALEPMLGGVK